jgi:hypothetical protein
VAQIVDAESFDWLQLGLQRKGDTRWKKEKVQDALGGFAKNESPEGTEQTRNSSLAWRLGQTEGSPKGALQIWNWVASFSKSRPLSAMVDGSGTTAQNLACAASLCVERRCSWKWHVKRGQSQPFVSEGYASNQKIYEDFRDEISDRGTLNCVRFCPQNLRTGNGRTRFWS